MLYEINAVMTGGEAFLLRTPNATHIGKASNNNSTSVLDLSQIADRSSFVSAEPAALRASKFCTSSQSCYGCREEAPKILIRGVSGC